MDKIRTAKYLVIAFLFFLSVFKLTNYNPDTFARNVSSDNTEYLKTLDDDTFKDDESLKPVLKNGSTKFKIAVVQSGEYIGYIESFQSILSGLINIGWMNDVELPYEESSMLSFLQKLNETNYSEYIEFSTRMFVDLEWDEEKAKSSEFNKIVFSEDVDLIVSLGTTATLILSKLEKLNTPVLGDSISDPVASGISLSYTDSGKDNLTVLCDPETYLRQIRLFYDTVKFKKLGVLYTDTVAGRSYAALGDVLQVSEEKGFEVVGFTKYLIEEEVPEADGLYLKALEEMCPSIDAIYLTPTAGMNLDNLPDILNILNRYNIPSFALAGSGYVENGVLYGVSIAELYSAGIYNARKIEKIFHGYKPRDLPQLFEHNPTISVNLKEAQRINHDVPVEVLLSTDEIYY